MVMIWLSPVESSPAITGSSWSNLGWLDTKPPAESLHMTRTYCDISYNNVLFFTQVSRLTFCLQLWHWNLYLHISSSLTLGSVIIFSNFTFWTSDSWLMFAMRDRCLEETTPCWIYWRQKTSASSFWKPYNELINSMLSTLSFRTEVRNTIIIWPT